MKNEYGESISHTAINNFCKKIRSKTNQEYYKNKKKKEKANEKELKVDEVVDSEIANKEALDDIVTKGVNDLDLMDSLIDDLNNVGLDVKNLRPEYGPQGGIITSKADVANIQIKAKRLLIELIKVKAMIFKDEPEPPDVNVFNLNGFDEDELKLAKEIAQKLAEPENYEEFDESVDSEDIS